jgi:hypothetical protein
MALRSFFAARREAPQFESVTPPLGRRLAVIVGVYLGYFYWVIYTAWRAGDRTGALILTAAMLALAAAHFVTMGGKNGERTLRVVVIHLTLATAVVLAVLNWRLGLWLAGISMGLVHLLTLALIAWIGLMVAITRSGGNSEAAS